MSQSSTPLDAIVIGTGFGGLAAAYRLKQAGFTYALLEQADRIGGTWRDNTYPGAACDVASHMYSFSWEPNPRWSAMFSGQAEILAYLEHVLRKHGLDAHLRLNTAVTGAEWDEPTSTWRVRTSKGETLSARTVITATGGLSVPSWPDIPGLAAFEGEKMHSARWNHAYQFAGKRIAVIGTGASAIQIVPALQPTVGRLHLFQRTPAWVLEKPDRPMRPFEHALFERIPAAQRALRARIYARNELHGVLFHSAPALGRVGERLAKRFLAKQVADPELRRKLTPDYRLGCKRVLLSNDFYPALTQPNVALVTDGIAEVRARSIVTRDGREREVDAIVCATGFIAADPVVPFPVVGRGGRTIEQAWADGAEAYLGTFISGFPNLFFIVGPNTGLGHNSMVHVIESQAQLLTSTLETMRRARLATVDVRPEVQRRYNDALQAKLKGTVWASGCRSWYVSKSGRNTTIWPGSTMAFRARTRQFQVAEYETTPATDEAPALGLSA